MTRFLTFSLLFLLSINASAQLSNVNEADRLLKADDIKGAKQAIDLAIENDLTKSSSRTWFQYGQVYKAIALSDQPAVISLSDDALNESVRAFKKTQELSPESNAYYTLADNALTELWSGLINKGVSAFSSSDFTTALESFEQALFVMPEDTTAYLYAGLMAQQLDDVPKTLQYYSSLIDLGYDDPSIYETVIYYTQNYKYDNAEALRLTREAQTKFPDVEYFRTHEINILIQEGKIEESIDALNEAVSINPSNANYLFNLGTLYETTGDELLAIENYERAIEIDSYNFDASYNLAVLHYNKAVDILAEINDLPLAEYEDKSPELEISARKSLNDALPHMEKATEIRPNEPVLWNTLFTIYDRLDMKDKSEAAYNRYLELIEEN